MQHAPKVAKHTLTIRDDLWKVYGDLVGEDGRRDAMLFDLALGIQRRQGATNGNGLTSAAPKSAGEYQYANVLQATRKVLESIDPNRELRNTDIPRRIAHILEQKPTVTVLEEEVPSVEAMIGWLSPSRTVRDLRALVSSNLTKIESEWGIVVP